jgi:small subunit ribosomal protein S11
MKANKKTQKKVVEKGRIYLVATFNNTIITITDTKGQPIVTRSTGMHGFSGTRKSTPYAAMVTVEATLKKAIEEFNLKEVDVFVKGIGPGRDAGMRIIRSSNLEVGRIVDITPIPHNGVRPPKIRRV